MTNFNELTERLNHLFDEESDKRPMSISEAANRRRSRVLDMLKGIENGDAEFLTMAIDSKLRLFLSDNFKSFDIQKVKNEDTLFVIVKDNKYKITVEKV